MKSILLLILGTASLGAQCRPWFDPVLGQLTCPPSTSSGATSSAVLTSVVPSGTAITYSVSTSTVQVFSVSTLAANIATNTMTATSATAGQVIQWIYTQNGTGGFTVVHPSQLLNACTVDPTANITTIITAVWDGTNAQATGCATNFAGLVVSGAEISARATPAAGTAVCWPDSTDHSGLECKANNSASVFKLVLSGVDINPVTGQVTATHLASALPVAQGGTALASGTSGGVLAYTASGTLASSGALTAGAMVVGGGAGAVPTAQAFGFGGSAQRAMEYIGGTIVYTTTNAASTAQEVTIVASMPFKARFDHIQLCETTQFAGNAGTLQISVGRTGANNAELVPLFSLKQSAGDANCWYERPSPPATPNSASTYAIVVNFISGSGNLSTLSAGVLTWEVVGYAIP